MCVWIGIRGIKMQKRYNLVCGCVSVAVAMMCQSAYSSEYLGANAKESHEQCGVLHSIYPEVYGKGPSDSNVKTLLYNACVSKADGDSCSDWVYGDDTFFNAAAGCLVSSSARINGSKLDDFYKCYLYLWNNGEYIKCYEECGSGGSPYTNSDYSGAKYIDTNFYCVECEEFSDAPFSFKPAVKRSNLIGASGNCYIPAKVVEEKSNYNGGVYEGTMKYDCTF